ncbi:flavin reductase [Micromonospora sp. CA-263727]|uniref:flavin reductase n=1 Tax=Micromonospora sp. CA-263727 TaxID=3239967 RepID=UPI003D8A3804
MNPASTNTPPSVDAAHFRHVVGHLASGVTVITTEAGAKRHGMTASSVTSLSLDPPMMLACINNAVPTAAAVSAAGRYAVNVLSEGQGDLARQFATASSDKFRRVALHTGALGLPLLTDALAHLECEVAETVVGGTHTIFLGRVVSATAGKGQPLTYFRGGFGRFAFARDDEVYGRARELILSRVYPADYTLPLEELAIQLDVDEAAAFYALTRLSLDGLVYRDSERGYVIAPFDVRTSDETFDARLAIELGAIALAMHRVTDDEVAELRRRFDAMAVLLVGDRFVDFHGYLDANYDFHEHLVALAGNPLLTATFGRLGIKSVMTRSFGSTPATSQKFVEVQERLVKAFEQRDASAAKQAAVDYCELAKERVREILSCTGGRL